MTTYEGMFIIRPNLAKEEKQKALESISGAITKEDGKILDSAEWGVRKLAYKIKRQREGLYIIMHFDMDSQKLAETQKAHRMNESILKFIVVKTAS